MSNATDTLLQVGVTFDDVSDDGRFLSYTRTVGTTQTLYVEDLTTGLSTTVDSVDVSTGTSGVEIHGVLSADGHYVFYEKGSAFPSSGGNQLLIKDLQSSGAATDVTPHYTALSSVAFFANDISADGQHIAYHVDLSTFSGPDAFHGIAFRDTAGGPELRTDAGSASLTPDGHYATYKSGSLLYVQNLQTNTFTVFGDNGASVSGSGGGRLSDDGRYFAYGESLGPASTDSQVYLYDFSLRENAVISTNGSGVLGNGASQFVAMSGDGRHVAFSSDATNLVANDTDGIADLFVKDLDTGFVQRVGFIVVLGTATAGGSGVTTNYDDASFSFDGSRLIYTFASAGAHQGGILSSDLISVPPALSIDTIAGDNIVNAHEAQNPIVVSGTSDAIGQTVHITSQFGETGLATVQSDGTWTTNIFAVGFSDGDHAIFSAAVAGYGVRVNASQSVVFDYTVTNTIGAVAGDDIVSPSELSAVLFSGSTDGDSVTLSIDNVVIGHPDVQPDGSWSFVYNGAHNGHTIADGHLDDGQHEVEVSTADAAGNVNTRSTFFDVHGPTAIPVLHFGGGIVTTDFQGSSQFGDAGLGVALQPDGRIRVAGESAGFAAAQARYDTNGSLDGTFDGDGKATADMGLQFPLGGSTAVFQTDGKAVLAGYTSSVTIHSPNTSIPVFALFRSSADGSADTTFNGTGHVLTDFGGDIASAADVAVQADGKIVAVGETWSGSTLVNQFAIARYNANGSLDLKFDGDGKVTTDINPLYHYSTASGVVIQPDGKIVVAGTTFDPVTTWFDFALARYNADGSLDTNFDVRYKSDGTVDPAVGSDGIVTTDIGVGSADAATGITLQADGKILVMGATDFRFALVRYNTDGSLDTSFDGDGIATVSSGTGGFVGARVTTQPDGKILVAGADGGDFAVVRFNADGSLDTSFGNGTGQVTTDIAGFGDGAASLLLQPDGKVLVVGTSQQSLQFEGGDTDFALVRYNADGSLDQTFGETVYIEHGPPVVLDHRAAIRDPEFSARDGGLGDFAGAQLTLARHGGPDAQDVFGAGGRLAFDALVVLLDGTAIGAQTQAGGTLTIVFGPDVTQDQGNAALAALTYATTYGGPSTEVGIDWTLSNPNVHPVVSALALSGTTEVRIVSDGSNAPPTGTSSTVTTLEDAARAFTAADFGFHDADAADTLHAVRIDTLPLAGTLALGAAAVTVGEIIQAADIPTLNFQAAANANGAAYATFTFSVSDGTDFAAAPGTLTIDVTAVNDAPVAQNGSASGNADTVINGAVPVATDVDSASLTYSRVTQAAHGSVTVNPDGTFSYTPNANFNGSDSFTFKANDGAADSNIATESLTVAAPTHAPPLPPDGTHLTGTPGDDSFTALPGSERIDAGTGTDTINFGFRLVDATVTFAGNQIIIDGPNSHTVLTGFEAYQFTDGTVNNNDSDRLVDDLYYYSQYHDVWNAHADADAHYRSIGWHEGRNPDAFFDAGFYLAVNPDVKAAGIDPLLHYDSFGWTEGRDPSLAFDTNAYLKANPDVAAAHVDPLDQFLRDGEQEGRQPIAPTELLAANGFDYVYYLTHNPDVAAAHVDPLQHYETIGWKEGRNPNALFDDLGYLAAYSDVAAAGINPLDHYNTAGWHEGRDPSVAFDTTEYLSHYADVANAHINPLNHFLANGIHEGRSPFADGVWG